MDALQKTKGNVKNFKLLSNIKKHCENCKTFQYTVPSCIQHTVACSFLSTSKAPLQCIMFNCNAIARIRIIYVILLSIKCQSKVTKYYFKSALH